MVGWLGEWVARGQQQWWGGWGSGFIVLFAINCTNQIKSNYLNSHGDEAQREATGL